MSLGVPGTRGYLFNLRKGDSDGGLCFAFKDLSLSSRLEGVLVRGLGLRVGSGLARGVLHVTSRGTYVTLAPFA